MQSVGTRLREARIKKGYTLEEINARTRISLKNLSAIESDDLKKISSPFTYRSFVKQISDAVGVDHATLAADAVTASRTMPEPLVPGQEEEPFLRPHQFQAQQKPKATWNWIHSASVAGAAGVLVVYLLFRNGGIGGTKATESNLPASSEVIAPQQPTPAPPQVSTPSPSEVRTEPPVAVGQNITPPTPVPALVSQLSKAPKPEKVVAVTTKEPEVAPGTEQLLPPSQVKKHQEQAVAKVVQPAAEPPVALVQTSAPVTSVADITPARIHIELSATRDTKLSITADGRTAYDGKLAAKHTVSFEGKETAQIHADNAGSVSIIFNGKSLGPMGRPGQSRTLVFTKNGYEVVQGVGGSTALARTIPTGGQ